MSEYQGKLPPIIKGFNARQHVDTAPTREVLNTLIYLNPEIDNPFDAQISLDIGKPTQLGVFLDTNETTIENSHALGKAEVTASHGRSIILGSKLVHGRSKNGGIFRHSIFRDFDAKGVGLYDYENGGKVSEIKVYHNATILGLLREETALHDRDIGEIFAHLGIRSDRTFAIIELQEVVIGNGEKISIVEARNRGLIFPDFAPVIEVRAFGTRARAFEPDPKYANQAKWLEDARKLVAYELGIEENKFTYLEYFKWFIQELARNIKRMHINEYVHGNLSPRDAPSNISADCRIVDKDTVIHKDKYPSRFKDLIEKDLNEALEVIVRLKSRIIECQIIAERRPEILLTKKNIPVNFEKLNEELNKGSEKDFLNRYDNS